MVSQTGRNAVLQRVEAKLIDDNNNAVDYTGPNQIGGPYNSALSAKVAGTVVYQEYSKYAAAYGALTDPITGYVVRAITVNNVKLNQAGSGNTYLASADGLLGVAAIPMKHDYVASTWRKDALPSDAYRLVDSLATDNSALIKAGYGVILKRMTGYNSKASAIYIKLYDKATAPLSTDVPKLVYHIPATAPFAFPLDDFVCQLGWGIRMTTGYGDSDTGALAASDIRQLLITFSQ